MNLETILQNETQLPPSPQILPKLLAMMESDESGVWEAVQLLRLDPSLSAQVLSWSNSAFYGFAHPSHDLEEAFNRIGVRELYRLVGILLAKRLVGKELDIYGIKDGQLWEYSIACALCMENLAIKVSEEPNLCYTIGLLHSLGKVLIDSFAKEESEAIFKCLDEESISLDKAEGQVLGFNNAEAADALLSKWKFEDRIRIPIAYQYNPTNAPEEYIELACLLHLSRWVIAGIGQNPGRHSWAIEVVPEALKRLNLDEGQLYLTLLDVHAQIHSIKKQLLNI